jgi:hypothetical protein
MIDQEENQSEAIRKPYLSYGSRMTMAGVPVNVTSAKVGWGNLSQLRQRIAALGLATEGREVGPTQRNNRGSY